MYSSFFHFYFLFNLHLCCQSQLNKICMTYMLKNSSKYKNYRKLKGKSFSKFIAYHKLIIDKPLDECSYEWSISFNDFGFIENNPICGFIYTNLFIDCYTSSPSVIYINVIDPNSVKFS